MENFVREYVKRDSIPGQGKNLLKNIDVSFEETLKQGDSIRFTKKNINSVAKEEKKHVVVEIISKDGKVSYQQCTSPLSNNIIEALKSGKKVQSVLTGLLSLPMLVGQVKTADGKLADRNYISMPASDIISFSIEELASNEDVVTFEPSDLIAF